MKPPQPVLILIDKNLVQREAPVKALSLLHKLPPALCRRPALRLAGGQNLALAHRLMRFCNRKSRTPNHAPINQADKSATNSLLLGLVYPQYFCTLFAKLTNNSHRNFLPFPFYFYWV